MANQTNFDNSSAPLANRAIITVGGSDRISFLQGLLTNDLNKVSSASWLYTLFLTPQGKTLFDLFVTSDDEKELLLIDVEAHRRQEFIARLNSYKLRSNAVINDSASDYALYVLSHDTTLSDDVTLMSGDDPRTPRFCKRVVVKNDFISKFKDELLNSNINQKEYADYNKYRILNGLPEGSDDLLPERSTVQECNGDLLNGIDWDKGCYLGQELTARIHYRQLAKRRLVIAKGISTLTSGSRITIENDPKAARLHSTEGDIGLALIKTEYLDSGQLNGHDEEGNIVRLEKPEWFDKKLEETAPQ